MKITEFRVINFTTIVAFSLAEVLITLAMIGIVAAITIPSVINKVQDTELILGLKKAYAGLSQATNQIILENGGTFKGIVTADDYYNIDLLNAYTSHLKVTKSCANAKNDGCWHPAGMLTGLSGANGDAFRSGTGAILNDGMLLTFIGKSSICEDNERYVTPSVCAWIKVDVNGFKSPNVVGRDVFYFYVTENKLEPWGTQNSDDQSCAGNGFYCATKRLIP